MGKCFLNLDRAKPAQELTFSRKKGDFAHPNIFFNDTSVERASDQKHLGLDKKIKFKMHIETVLCKIPIIKKLRQRLSRKSLLTTYKAF